jgi:hypothetical protein
VLLYIDPIEQGVVMNIKGKHLKLCRLIKANFGIETKKVVDAGFELSMIESLRSKGIVSYPIDKLYLPLEIANRV